MAAQKNPEDGVEEKSILFNAEMVKAVLGGRKTQTRRAIMVGRGVPLSEDGAWQWSPKVCLPDEYGPREGVWWSVGNGHAFKCPFGKAGDRLWVRESFFVQPGIWQRHHGPQPVEYSADVDDRAQLEDYDRKPSIHMPRWASRLTLGIVEVRAQKLQDLADSDAVAEGIERVGGRHCLSPWRNYRKGVEGEMSMDCSCPRRSFMTLWESIHGKGAWEANPWVWATTFKVG